MAAGITRECHLEASMLLRMRSYNLESCYQPAERAAKYPSGATDRQHIEIYSQFILPIHSAMFDLAGPSIADTVSHKPPRQWPDCSLILGSQCPTS